MIDVISFIAKNDVHILAAVNNVVTGFPGNVIFARFAIYRVVIIAAKQIIVAGTANQPVFAGLATGAACGAVNGGLIAYARLPPFVVTLGMLSVARSLAIVLSQNKMIYEFGPYADQFNWIGGGDVLGISNPVWALILAVAVIATILFPPLLLVSLPCLAFASDLLYLQVYPPESARPEPNPER